MKKRLTCLLLCLAMLLSLGLTACKDKTEDEIEQGIADEASASAKTLTMWVVSENEISEKTAKEVNEALNDITKSKFKTQLIVKFLTKDGKMNLDMNDEIVKGMMTTMNGKIVHEGARAAMGI